MDDVYRGNASRYPHAPLHEVHDRDRLDYLGAEGLCNCSNSIARGGQSLQRQVKDACVVVMSIIGWAACAGGGSAVTIRCMTAASCVCKLMKAYERVSAD